MAVQTNDRVAETLSTRIEDLMSYVQQGRIIEAMNEFYDPDVQMQENNNPPTRGLAANLERERAFVAGVKEWKSLNIEAISIDASRARTFVQSNAEYINTAGQTVKSDQVAVQTWRNGKVIHEKFYYNAAV